MKNALRQGALAMASVLMMAMPLAVEAASVKQAVKAVMPSVVEVHVFNDEGKQVGSGSGVIVGRNGLVVTNYHVIKGKVGARVILHDGEALRVAGVREVDAERDFAILQVESTNLAAAVLGDSNKVESGDNVIAVGAPMGLPKVVTNGIVSRIWVEKNRLIQHTAPISPGNSGGPLLNEFGQLIGLNTFLIKEGQNLNFALPINCVKFALNHLPKEVTSLPELSAAQNALEEKNQQQAAARLLKENFHLYEDPDGLFQVALPNDWLVQRSVSKEKDGSVTVLFMASAPGAEQARMNGWLSAGIRLRIVLPPQGRQWAENTRLEWAKEFLSTTLAGYESRKTSDAETSIWGKREGVEVLVLGTAPKLSELELASITLLPSTDALVAIEIALPAQHKEAFQFLRAIFQKSFSLGS